MGTASISANVSGQEFTRRRRLRQNMTMLFNKALRAGLNTAIRLQSTSASASVQAAASPAAAQGGFCFEFTEQQKEFQDLARSLPGKRLSQPHHTMIELENILS